MSYYHQFIIKQIINGKKSLKITCVQFVLVYADFCLPDGWQALPEDQLLVLQGGRQTLQNEHIRKEER